MFAARAGHEGKRDPQRVPLVPQELHDAISVENVPAGQPRTRLVAKLLRVANCAQFILIHAIKVTHFLSAVFVEAGCALSFAFDSLALVATLMSFRAKGKRLLVVTQVLRFGQLSFT